MSGEVKCYPERVASGSEDRKVDMARVIDSDASTGHNAFGVGFSIDAEPR